MKEKVNVTDYANLITKALPKTFIKRTGLINKCVD